MNLSGRLKIVRDVFLQAEQISLCPILYGIVYIAFTVEWLKPPAPFLRIHDGFRKSTSPRSNISKSVDSFISQIYA